MTTKTPDLTDINALALEACDMWQEHLSNLANDPSSRSELTKFLEPQRRLFADWAAMMQGGNPENGHAKEPSAKDNEPAGPTKPASASAAPSGVASHGDDPLRVAQLALRVAELEKRIAQLEQRIAETP